MQSLRLLVSKTFHLTRFPHLEEEDDFNGPPFSCRGVAWRVPARRQWQVETRKECERPGGSSSFAETEGPGSELLLRMCGSQRRGIKRRGDAASTPEKLLEMFSSNVVIMETEAFVVSEARRRHGVKKETNGGLAVARHTYVVRNTYSGKHKVLIRMICGVIRLLNMASALCRFTLYII